MTPAAAFSSGYKALLDAYGDLLAAAQAGCFQDNVPAALAGFEAIDEAFEHFEIAGVEFLRTPKLQ